MATSLRVQKVTLDAMHVTNHMPPDGMRQTATLLAHHNHFGKSEKR
jgi:hypothetical protein